MRIANQVTLARTARVSMFGLWLVAASMLIALLVLASNATAADRGEYLHFFYDPASKLRFEPLFVAYGYLMRTLLNSPEASIALTSVFIWLLMGASWKRLCHLPLVESALLFTFVAVGVFNYFLGIAIRNGIACALGVYAAVRVLQGDRRFWILLLLVPGIHYAMLLLPFAVGFTIATRHWKRHLFLSFILIGTVILPFVYTAVYLAILHSIGQHNEYYVEYIVLVATDRFRGLSMLLFAVAALGVMRMRDSLLSRFVLTAVPFLVLYLASGSALLARPIMPQLFVALALCASVYAPLFRRLLSPPVWLWTLSVLQVATVAYVLRMYGLV